jgi:hypothetical protein
MLPPELANAPPPDWGELLRRFWALLRQVAGEMR